jgi:hypothetical protein
MYTRSRSCTGRACCLSKVSIRCRSAASAAVSAPRPSTGAAGEEQQHRRPEVGDQHVHRHHAPEHAGVHLEDLLHRRLVGAAADPAAGDRGEAAPGLAADDLGADEAPDQDRERPAQQHARGAGEEHDQGLGSEPGDGGQVHAQRQQHERGRQQVARGDEVQARVLAVDEARGVEQRGDEVAQQQRRHHGIEPAPEAVRVVLGPEHEAQDRGEQAEDDGVVGDHGRLL